MSDAAATIADSLTDAQAAKLLAAATGKGPRAKAAAKAKEAPPAEAKSAPVRRFEEARTAPQITVEAAARLAPTIGQVAKMVEFFALKDLHAPTIREATVNAITSAARALQECMNALGLKIYLHRVVDGYVRAAYGAAQHYDQKANEARDLSSPFANQHRDEDRMGIDGQENEAGKARATAAQAGVNAFAALVAAQGAVTAYVFMTGDEWRPYSRSVAPGRSVARRAAAEELSCFDRN
ncbi:hypothetical protein HLH34_18885 [Gluconacetobacter azotocaptans]|uniref:Uncharacterized protein n=1 Tax=Gluconacetobacter azotocaptans TaxID=142834 RepID=A0A7W4PFR4_9PROT|nr:hypothetical protein [Gluconacetobacter azotocaptans]MBB2192000.1 hypothetical protein [Gluconacetobacter azotocaptans]GBQ34119.1 hypothetical protein AA13594_2808 [Gluconacetobacter azotocaptans DSM 13594]